jgi:hypothetical protein
MRLSEILYCVQSEKMPDKDRLARISHIDIGGQREEIVKLRKAAHKALEEREEE